ncbi:hypothetical protein Godav_002615, partial [Gossypium davidsonii]|nr:hypothetical protein [Gossypium davidsonii]
MAIPSYFMQSMLIPKGLCEEIECMPGGLGFQKLQDHNTSFMMKLGFRIVSDSRALWLQVLRANNRVAVGIPENLSHKVLGHSSACGVCGHIYKDVLHVLKDFPVATDILKLLIPSDRFNRFYSSNLQEWTISNLHNQYDICFGKVDWECLFEIIIWRIWNNRNLFIFQDTSWSSFDTIRTSYSWAKHVLKIDQSYLNTERKMTLFEDDSIATIRVVGDRNRECIIGYKRFLGSCSVFKAELWGLLDGLNILIDRGLDNNIFYIPRADNQEADRLAKMVHSGSQDLRKFEISPFGELG